jgi:hypothetical protein
MCVVVYKMRILLLYIDHSSVNIHPPNSRNEVLPFGSVVLLCKKQGSGSSSLPVKMCFFLSDIFQLADILYYS